MKQPVNRSLFLFTALVLVHLLFFLSSQFSNPSPLSDSEDYINASRNLYGQGVLYCGDLSAPIVEEQFTRRPPLYPLILGSAIITGSTIPMILLQILFSILSILLVYRIFVLKELEPKLIVLAFFFLLATPAQFIYSNRIMAEIPFQLLLVLMAWSVYKYYEEPGNRNGRYIWMFNLFLTLGMATKPVLFPFALFSILVSLYIFLKSRKPAHLLALIMPILWISFYSVWNYNRTGSAQYSSIQTANLVNYNLRYFIIGQDGSEAASATVDQLYNDCGIETSYKEKNQCLKTGVRELILERPVKYGLFHLKGSVRYFLDPGRFDMVTYFNTQEADAPGFLQAVNEDGLKGVIRFLKQQGWGLMIILGLIVVFKLVKISGFLLYLLRRNEQQQLNIFLMILVGYLALVTGPLGASRFLLPVELLIIGGAIKGWSPILLKRFWSS